MKANGPLVIGFCVGKFAETLVSEAQSAQSIIAIGVKLHRALKFLSRLLVTACTVIDHPNAGVAISQLAA